MNNGPADPAATAGNARIAAAWASPNRRTQLLRQDIQPAGATMSVC